MTNLRDAVSIYEESLCSLSSSTQDSQDVDGAINGLSQPASVAFPSNLLLRMMQHAIHVRPLGPLEGLSFEIAVSALPHWHHQAACSISCHTPSQSPQLRAPKGWDEITDVRICHSRARHAAQQSAAATRPLPLPCWVQGLGRWKQTQQRLRCGCATCRCSPCTSALPWRPSWTPSSRCECCGTPPVPPAVLPRLPLHQRALCCAQPPRRPCQHLARGRRCVHAAQLQSDPAHMHHQRGVAQVASAHRLGKEHYARRVVKSLFDAFLLVEERFSTNTESTEQEKIDAMRTVKVLRPPNSQPGWA